MQYLFKREKFVSAITPGLVLLDMHMPRVDGWEVLKQLRVNETTCHIPVVVMTSSDYDKEFHAQRGLQADGYVVKPVSMRSVVEVIEVIRSYRATKLSSHSKW